MKKEVEPSYKVDCYYYEDGTLSQKTVECANINELERLIYDIDGDYSDKRVLQYIVTRR